MKRIIILAFLCSSLQAQGASLAEQTDLGIECTAQLRIVKGEQVTEQRQALSLMSKTEVGLILSTDFVGKAFTLSVDLANDRNLISITDAPDYTKGILATTAFGAGQRIQISSVDGNTVYKLECLKR